MNLIFKARQSGFAIIEALIAFLLLGIGVAALVYLQGNLMSGSSQSKASAEAMELAKYRTEILRNSINEEQYISALGSVQDESEAGVNTTYAVSYTILQDNDDTPPILSPIDADNPLTTDKTQNLTVKVSWIGSEGDSEEVSLETILYFTKPEVSSAINAQNNGDASKVLLPSPLISGVEGKDPSTASIKLADNNSLDNDIATDDDKQLGITIERYIAVVAADGAVRSNVEVSACLDKDKDGTCEFEVVLTSFGGIVHKLQGEIIINTGANTTLAGLSDNLQILASPPSYCVFPICEGGSVLPDGTLFCPADAEKAQYICYVPGDCTYGVADDYVVSTPPDNSNPGCPADFISPTDDDFDDLNGGWYGRVGNFGVAIHPDDKVCTADTDADSTTFLTPSREYVTHRYGYGCSVALSDDGTCPSLPLIWKIIGNEGINTPYSAQTFLITRTNTDCNDVATDNFEPDILLVDEQIKRELSVTPDTSKADDPNVVLPENKCITGLSCP